MVEPIGCPLEFLILLLVSLLLHLGKSTQGVYLMLDGKVLPLQFLTES